MASPPTASPLPKCQKLLGVAQPSVALFSTSVVYGGRAFDRAWLGRDLAVCGPPLAPGHPRAAPATTTADAGPAVLLGTASTPVIMAELSRRKLRLRAELGGEGYVLD